MNHNRISMYINIVLPSQISSILWYAGSSSFTALGTIEGKFDCGYMVSMKLGSQTLKGVLYYIDDSAACSTPKAEPATGAIVPYKGNRRYRRRRNRRRGDPNYPKPNRSGYNFFFAEKHSNLKSLYPNREREFTKMIGQSWNNLTPEERKVKLFFRSLCERLREIKI